MNKSKNALKIIALLLLSTTYSAYASAMEEPRQRLSRVPQVGRVESPAPVTFPNTQTTVKLMAYATFPVYFRFQLADDQELETGLETGDDLRSGINHELAELAVFFPNREYSVIIPEDYFTKNHGSISLTAKGKSVEESGGAGAGVAAVAAVAAAEEETKSILMQMVDQLPEYKPEADINLEFTIAQICHGLIKSAGSDALTLKLYQLLIKIGIAEADQVHRGGAPSESKDPEHSVAYSYEEADLTSKLQEIAVSPYLFKKLKHLITRNFANTNVNLEVSPEAFQEKEDYELARDYGDSIIEQLYPTYYQAKKLAEKLGVPVRYFPESDYSAGHLFDDCITSIETQKEKLRTEEAKVAETTAALVASKADLATLQEQSSSQSATTAARIRTLEEDFAAKDAALKAAQGEATRLQATITQSVKSLETVKAELVALQEASATEGGANIAKISTLEAGVAAKTAELAELQESTSAARAALEDKIGTISGELESAKGALIALKAASAVAAEQTAAEKAQLEAVVAARAAELEREKELVARSEAAIAAIKAELKASQAQSQTTEKRAGELQAALEGSKREVGALTEERDALKASSGASLEELQSLQQQHRKETEDLEAAKEELAATLAGIEVELGHASKATERTAGENAELTRRIELLQEKVNAKDADILRLESVISERNRENIQIKANISRTEKELAAAVKRSETLSTQLEAEKAALRDARDQASALRVEMAKLTAQLESANRGREQAEQATAVLKGLMDKQINALEKREAAINDALTAERERHDAILEDSASDKDRLAKLSADIATLQATELELKSAIEGAELAKKEALAELSDELRAVFSQKQAVHELEQASAKSRAESLIAIAQQAQETAKRSAAIAREEATRAKADADRARKESARLLGSIDEQRAANDKLRDALASATRDAHELKQRNQAMQREIATHESNMSDLVRELSAAKGEIADRDDKIAKLVAILKGASVGYAALAEGDA